VSIVKEAVIAGERDRPEKMSTEDNGASIDIIRTRTIVDRSELPWRVLTLYMYTSCHLPFGYVGHLLSLPQNMSVYLSTKSLQHVEGVEVKFEALVTLIYLLTL
jgi:hypothetical protein